MSRLLVTFIDTAWGDSILIESHSEHGQVRYGLIDCNDNGTSRPAAEFIRRRVEANAQGSSIPFPLFDFVLLSHGHADHSNGLATIMKQYGTRWFWYPKTTSLSAIKTIAFANRFTREVRLHQAVDRSRELPDLGDVNLKILWPPYQNDGPYDPENENNNSVVLALTLDRVSIVLTSDCEANNWSQILEDLPTKGVRIFQVPCHGAEQGMFDRFGQTPWLDHLKKNAKVVISGHSQLFSQPDPVVVSELERRKIKTLRTDEHYHVTISTNGRTVQAKAAT